MDCWLQQRQPARTEMNSFAERQAALLAQMLGDFTRGSESCVHNINWGLSHYADTNSDARVSNSGRDGVNLGGCKVTDGWWPHCGFGLESLPELVPESSNHKNIVVPAQEIFHSVDEFEENAQLSLPVWQRQPSVSEVCCRESPVKRLRNGSFNELDDILKKLPPGASELGLQTPVRMSHHSISVSTSPIRIPPLSPQFSSDVSFSSRSPFSRAGSVSAASSPTQHSEEKPQLQSYRTPSYLSVEPQSIVARQRRIIIREKITYLEKLIPQDSKLDISRKLEEAAKYIKLLQAQVKVLECMPLADSKAELKPNPNGAKDNAHLSLTSNASSRNRCNDLHTNGLTLQRSVCLFNKLSRQQMLHIMLASPRIQRKLFSAEKVVGTVQQKEILLFSTDLSNFHDD